MKCHWCNKLLRFATRDHEDRIYECEDGHCILTLSKDHQTIKKYEIFIDANDSGKERFLIVGVAQQKYTSIYARTSGRKLKHQFDLDYIPLTIGNDDIIMVNNLLNANKIKKYILFS